MPHDSFDDSLKHIVHSKNNIINKKWRREIKQQIENENLFKRSKEKKLDFSINESPVDSNFKDTDPNMTANKNRSSVHRIRNELIQDDSDEDFGLPNEHGDVTLQPKNSDSQLIKHVDDAKSVSYSSNPLQKIIEQRRLESSTDSEESEDELDDDYDIGIDDIDLDNTENDEIHTATEDDESNILINSMESQMPDGSNSYKRKLKETLVKPKGKSPFTDLMERGISDFLDMHKGPGKRRSIRLSNKMLRESSKKQPRNVNDYISNERESKERIDRPTSGLRKQNKLNKAKEIESIESGFEPRDSIDISPSGVATNARQKGKNLDEVRQDRPHFDFNSGLNKS